MNVGFVVSRVLEESKHVNPNCFTVTAPAPCEQRMTNTRYIGMKNANTANSFLAEGDSEDETLCDKKQWNK